MMSERPGSCGRRSSRCAAKLLKNSPNKNQGRRRSVEMTPAPAVRARSSRSAVSRNRVAICSTEDNHGEEESKEEDTRSHPSDHAHCLCCPLDQTDTRSGPRHLLQSLPADRKSTRL